MLSTLLWLTIGFAPLAVTSLETYMGDVSKSNVIRPSPNTHDLYELRLSRGAETLSCMEGRFQLPDQAKFNRPDPQRDWNWLLPHTINLYEYVGNDPINYWDPSGFGDQPFREGIDKEISPISGTETPRDIWIPLDFGHGLMFPKGFGVLVTNPNQYNCHSYAFCNSMGDPSDVNNRIAVKLGAPRFVVQPFKQIRRDYVSLDFSEANYPGDRVIYYIDSNGNNEFDEGEFISHSAIVTKVDEDGNTVEVAGKLGAYSISFNHLVAPGYYETDVTSISPDGQIVKGLVSPTKRQYLREKETAKALKRQKRQEEREAKKRAKAKAEQEKERAND